MKPLKQIWLFEDTINRLDENKKDMSRAQFADMTIKIGINHRKNVLFEIVDQKLPHRPKKSLPATWISL
jgi:hypothetical protein